MQRRFEPIQNRLAGGCSLIRPIVTLVSESGYTITDLDVFYAMGAKFSGAMSLGVAAA
jgi:hypothetical protein